MNTPIANAMSAGVLTSDKDEGRGRRGENEDYEHSRVCSSGRRGFAAMDPEQRREIPPKVVVPAMAVAAVKVDHAETNNVEYNKTTPAQRPG
jgi:hypothetical protein